MYGKQINNGDILVEGDNYGEVALFFKIIDEKPVLVARWGISTLSKYNVEIIRGFNKDLKKQMETNNNIPEFMINYWKNVADRIEVIQTNNLMLVEGINVEIINKFLDDGCDVIEYTSINGMDIDEKPIAYFPDKQIVGEY